MPYQKPVLTALVIAPLFLAACKGAAPGEDTGSSATTAPDLPFTENETLLTSFLSSLDSVRSQANRLMTQDARYRLQTAPSGVYLDQNNNNRYDRGVDSDLQGNPLEHAGVHFAHAAGLTGAGQVIAFSDNGFRTDHEAFDGRTITTGANLLTADHGTFVASVATGNSDDMIGVAPEADMIFGSFSSMSQLSETATQAAAAGAVALNNSWGYSNRYANTTDFNAIFGNSSGQSYLNALRTYAQDGIVVFAVPNNSNIASTGLMPALPLFDPSLEQSWIAVVNGVPELSGDDIISAERVSEGCYEAAEWCLAANGTWTGASASAEDSYGFGTGSSYAAPTVSGALALLAEAFPDLSHQQLRIRLLASADNDFDGFTESGTTELVSGFDHAYSDEWGHGFLDIGAALLPIGQPTLTTANGTVLPMDRPLVVTGNASGDAVSRALKNVTIQSRDTLSAGFSVDAGQLVAQRQAAPLFSQYDLATVGRRKPSALSTPSFFGNSQAMPVLFGPNDMAVTLFHGETAGNDQLGFGISRAFELGAADLHVRAALGEDIAALLSDWSGGTRADIASVDLSLATDLAFGGQFRFDFGYAMGRESTQLGQAANVMMTSTGVSYSQTGLWRHGDRLNISATLPAAISSGSTALTLPMANASGITTYQDVRVDLAPNSREVRLALTYERPLGRHTNIGLSFAHAENRGNIAGLTDTAVMVGLTSRF